MNGGQRFDVAGTRGDRANESGGQGMVTVSQVLC